MEKNQCSRCSVPFRSTPSRVRCSGTGTGFTPEARCPRKAGRTHPECISNESPPPSSEVTWNRANRSSKILSGSGPVPNTSPTDRGGRGGLGAPMADIAAGWQDSVIQQHHRLLRGMCLGGNRSHEPSQEHSKKWQNVNWRLKVWVSVLYFPHIWGKMF